MYFQSTGCDSLASQLTLGNTVGTVLLTWVWGLSHIQIDVKEQWHLDAYISRLITKEGCVEEHLCMSLWLHTHTNTVRAAALKTAHPSHNAPQSEAWLQRQELNSSRAFCFIFRL